MMWLWLLERYTTELMVQKGHEIVKYGSRAEILDFLIMILNED
jgi:hypothetical protein